MLPFHFCIFTHSYSSSDPVSVKMSVGTGRVSTEALALMREEMGLNQPLLVQYGNWLLKFLQGDFGKSLISDIPTKI